MSEKFWINKAELEKLYESDLYCDEIIGEEECSIEECCDQCKERFEETRFIDHALNRELMQLLQDTLDIWECTCSDDRGFCNKCEMCYQRKRIEAVLGDENQS